MELSDVAREKLRAMLTPEAYELSLSAYHETGGTKKPPTLDQIKAEIMTWPVDRLRKECEMREKPTLLIVSDNSFNDGIEEMNKNKHYENTQGTQQDAYFNRGNESPYVDAPKPNKGRVSITDGKPKKEQLEGVSTKLGKRRDHLTREYEAAGMRHIDAVEMQALMQRSLIEACKAKDNNFVVDHWERGNDTVTFLNPDSLNKSALVACSRFDSRDHRVNFSARDPDAGAANLLGRATVQVMEF